MSAKENIEALIRQAENFWLMKSEPGECSIDDALAAPDHKVSWFGVRNYQARNFMRDAMKPGDAVLFYHSSARSSKSTAGFTALPAKAPPTMK